VNATSFSGLTSCVRSPHPRLFLRKSLALSHRMGEGPWVHVVARTMPRSR
jgi:hypothetical protein